MIDTYYKGRLLWPDVIVQLVRVPLTMIVKIQ